MGPPDLPPTVLLEGVSPCDPRVPVMGGEIVPGQCCITIGDVGDPVSPGNAPARIAQIPLRGIEDLFGPRQGAG